MQIIGKADLLQCNLMRSGKEGLILTSLRGYDQAVAIEREGRMLKRKSF